VSLRDRARSGLVLLAVLVAGFAWGFLAQRKKMFPHPILRRIAVKMGVKIWEKPLELASATPAFGTTASLPYLNGQIDPHPAADGVVLNSDRAQPGYNFFSVPGRRTAFLMDMRGKLLWRWSLSRYPYVPTSGLYDDVGFTHLYPNGDVLAFIERHTLLKLDKSSRILWEYDAQVHHDSWVCPDGTIYTIIHRQRFDRKIHPEGVILADSVVILSPEGRVREEISLLDALENSPYAFLLPKPSRTTVFEEIALDVLHTNHIEVFDGNLERLSPLFRKGNILVSFKDICSIAILDGRTHRILWIWGPTNLTLQHHSTAVSNGDVLLFNNGLRRSEVLEVDPRTDTIVWRYAPGEDFFSSIRGSCQRLANGDTLIGVSQAGYSVEVTAAGEVVWKFINPDIGPEHFRQAIFGITRFDPRSLHFLPKAAIAAGRDGV
jgi:hypothetical protein